MRNATRLIVAALCVPLLLVTTASAAGFSPKLRFELNRTKVRANPALKIHLSQDRGEQELGHVTLKIPAGFKLPKDRAIPNGDDVGIADITIHTGTRCSTGLGTSAPATFENKSIYEQNRTAKQRNRGVRAVWVVDLKPVTTVPLEIYGSPRRGYRLEGEIPSNPNTCPPLVFDAKIFRKSAESRVAIIRNPGSPGRYAFKGILETQDSPAIERIRQVIRIHR